MFFSRGKNKLVVDYATSDGYSFYLNTIDMDSKYKLTQKQYIDICKNFNNKLIEYFLDHGGNIKFPCNCGTLDITSRETPYGDASRMPIDWKSTNERGKIIYHLNEHTNGKRFKIIWDKPNIKHGDYYMFKIKRDWLRYLAAKVKGGDIKYG